jgi:hypothetical protein
VARHRSYTLMRSIPSARGGPLEAAPSGLQGVVQSCLTHSVEDCCQPCYRTVAFDWLVPKDGCYAGANCGARDLSPYKCSGGHPVGKSLLLSWLLSRCLQKGAACSSNGPGPHTMTVTNVDAHNQQRPRRCTSLPYPCCTSAAVTSNSRSLPKSVRARPQRFATTLGTRVSDR